MQIPYQHQRVSRRLWPAGARHRPCTASQRDCVAYEGQAPGSENALNWWLRACKGTSAADPTSRDYGRWQPGARRCKLTLIDDGPRVDETARALARMPHEESRTVGQDLRTWLNSRHPWTG